MRPLIVHASSKSQSLVPRRVLHIEYGASWTTEDGMELKWHNFPFHLAKLAAATPVLRIYNPNPGRLPHRGHHGTRSI
jgi:hypothetical protein